MNEILIIDAFEEITKQIEKNNIEVANKMLELVAAKIDENKKKNVFSEYINLSSNKEMSLFSNLPIK